MKENSNKDIELIRKLSQLMSKEKITKLKYERSDFKLSIDKNTQSEKLTTFQTPNLVETEIKENKNLETKTNFDANHPGALKAPMVGTAYVSPEPGKAPFIRIGDTVLIERAGDVIPKVVKVIKEKRPTATKRFTLPTNCPVCKHQVYQTDGEAILR